MLNVLCIVVVIKIEWMNSTSSMVCEELFTGKMKESKQREHEVYGTNKNAAIQIKRVSMERNAVRELCGEVCGVDLNAIDEEMATICLPAEEILVFGCTQEGCEENPWVKGMYGPVIACGGTTRGGTVTLQDKAKAEIAEAMEWVSQQASLLAGRL
jgi:hypothetical protein